MAKYDCDKNIQTLRQENRVLLHDLRATRQRLAEMQARVTLAERSATEAWSFAKVIFHGRPGPAFSKNE